jgi:hypothetical protein
LQSVRVAVFLRRNSIRIQEEEGIMVFICFRGLDAVLV